MTRFVLDGFELQCIIKVKQCTLNYLFLFSSAAAALRAIFSSLNALMT